MASFNPAGSTNSSRSPLQNIADQARIWWDGSPTSTRVISIGLAILVVLCLAGAIMLATAPQYEDLFTNLDPHDAAAIAQKLDDAHEKYQITNGDTTIRVPGADKDRLRMEMVRNGLPAKSGSVVGSDWLDKIGMSTTSDVQNQYIRMANEGELSQTISSMNEVSSAAVHLSPGNNSPFATSDSPPTASVVVGLKPGASLTSDQTMGIANLVAKAVPGLDIKNVAVVDTNGNQLWDGGAASGPGGLASNRMVAEQQFSDGLRRQMQSYLDAVLGAHKALVSVHAELNYNQVHSMQTVFAKGAVLSSQSTDEKYSGSGGQSSMTPAGVASNTQALGNVPQYPIATGGSKGGNYENQGDTTNYSNDKTETETQQAPGGIQRLNVAVLIDNAIPPATVSSIQTYLSTLAGVTQGDASRIVTVQPVAFTNADFKNQQTLMNATAAQARMAEMVRIAAVAMVAIILLVIFLRSTKSGPRMVSASSPQLGDSRAGMPQFETNDGPAGALGSPNEHLLDEPMSIEDLLAEMPAEPVRAAPVKRKVQQIVPEIEEHMDIKLESIREMVKSHPQSVVLLMKGWMADEVDNNR